MNEVVAPQRRLGLAYEGGGTPSTTAASSVLTRRENLHRKLPLCSSSVA